MSELDLVLQEFHAAAQALINACESMRAFYGGVDEPPVPVEPKANAKPEPPSLETVRKALAEKSRKGFTAEIKELLVKHGAVKLSEIDPGEYAAILAEAEVLGNG
jgi:hypothetical protein